MSISASQESIRRYNRSDKAKAARKRYYASERGKITRWLIEREPRRMLHKRLYQQEYRCRPLPL